MPTSKPYLEFSRTPTNKKTMNFDVISSTTGLLLGRVYFRPQWRKYIFQPARNTLYDSVCMQQVADFCDLMTRKWRESVKERHDNSRTN